jgi:hypothetical protein
VGAAADDVGFPVSLDGLPVFERYGLLLAGGYAFRAHEISHRPSQDLDFATRDNTPLPEIAEHVRLAFQAAGYGVLLVEATGRYARLVLRLPDSGDELEMDLLKEALELSWVTVQITPSAGVRALSLDDTVGLKARAWHDRFVIRDIIDLHAVASTFPTSAAEIVHGNVQRSGAAQGLGSSRTRAGVVQHIDSAEPSRGAVQGCGQCGTVGDVGRKAGRHDPFGRQFLGQLAEPLLRAGDQRDIESVTTEDLSEGQAEACPGGHERDCGMVISFDEGRAAAVGEMPPAHQGRVMTELPRCLSSTNRER